MHLTEANVKAAVCPPDKAQLEIVDDGCRGLTLVVGKAAKTWQARFSLAGRRIRMLLGRHPAVSLAQARVACSAAMLAVDKGGDPRFQAATVASAWVTYWSRKAPTLKHPAHDLSAWRRHIEPIIGTMDLSYLSPLVFDRLVDTWRKAGLGVGQGRPRRVLKGFEGYLLARRLIDRAFIHSDVVFPVSPQPAIPPLDVVIALWHWCEGRGQVGAILRLLIASGARSAMISDLAVGEVRSDTLVWTALRMKDGRPFVCPISPAMRMALDDSPIPPGSAWVFPNRDRTGPTGVDLSAHIAKSPLAGFRMHTLRSALVTHGGDRFGWPPHIRAALLDHSPSAVMGGSTGRYIAADGTLCLAERREALDAWASLLLKSNNSKGQT